MLSLGTRARQTFIADVQETPTSTIRLEWKGVFVKEMEMKGKKLDGREKNKWKKKLDMRKRDQKS